MTNRQDKGRRIAWRWMILLSRFAWSFIGLGKFKAMGVFIPHIVVSFSTSTAVAGFVTSTTVGFGSVVCGPIAGALLKIWSPRRVAMVGGALAGTATVAGAFSSSVGQLGALFAVESIGLNLIQVAMIPPIMEYFPDDFAFANGVTLAGGTVGMMVLPPLAEYLVFLYGWRGALIVMGALCFNYIVCGALLRSLGRRYDLVPSHDDASEELPPPCNPTKTGSSDSKVDPDGSFLRTVSETLRERFDTQALTQPKFIIIQVVCVLEGMVFTMWHLFLIPHGIELGFGDSASAFLATYGGIGSLIGRLSHGIFVDLGLIKASLLFVLSSLVFAASNLLDPLAVSLYASMAVLASITGTAIGVLYPLTFVLVRELVGDRQMSAFGWIFVSHGSGQLLGGVFAGWVHDVSSAYEIVFMTTGMTSAVMAAIVGLMQYFSYVCKSEE